MSNGSSNQWLSIFEDLIGCSVRSMTWTPLHRALGETSLDLTYSMVEQAVEQQIEETADLDWKSQMPLTVDMSIPRDQKEKERYELAKDIAAMANTGGGMIVYGVGETAVNQRTAAGSITPGLRVTTDDCKRIRQAAFSTVHPPVVGLELKPLSSTDDGQDSVLAMIIPESMDAPHLVVKNGDGGFFQAPWRNGPDTVFMAERELAQAYLRREQGRRQQIVLLEESESRFLKSIGTKKENSPIWSYAIARPAQPLMNSNSMGNLSAEGILRRAADYPWMKKESTAITEIIGDSNFRTCRGLRKFYWTMSRNFRERTFRARIELHSDGSIAVGITRDGFIGENDINPLHLRLDDIEKIGLDLTAILLEFRKAGGPQSDYDVRFGVVPVPTAFRRRDSVSEGYLPPCSGDEVQDFYPVEGTIITNLGRRQLLDSAVELINDVMNQAGSMCALSGTRLDDELSVGE
ncbi:hypothetical protein DCC26_11785 [Auritidibacter sp. NML120779]|nr:hypothetical protein DCC26_11785 [Auritidibacter sp. NML120779]